MQQMILYCRSYCLLNMFRAPLCPSSGAREYYTSGCCLSYVSGLRAAALSSSSQTGHTTLSSTPYRQLENQTPNTTGSNHLYNTVELLMMGIMVPETCGARNKICNKNSSVASSWHFISTVYLLVYTLSEQLSGRFKTGYFRINLSVYLGCCGTYTLVKSGCL